MKKHALFILLVFPELNCICFRERFVVPPLYKLVWKIADTIIDNGGSHRWSISVAAYVHFSGFRLIFFGRVRFC